jgi:general secretion pathway protein F
VIVVGLIIASFMLIVVLPWASKLLAESGRDLPWLTACLLAAGRAVQYGGAPFLALALVVFVTGGRRWRAQPAFRAGVDRRLFRIPVIGRGYTLLVNMRFARTLAILLHSGVQVIEGLGMAGRATGSPWVEALVERECDGVRHGGSLAAAVRSVPPLAGSLPGWIEAGEASGALERMLECAGARYGRQWESYISRCLGLFEPLLILAIGLFVLLITLSVLLPILSLSHTLE